MPALVSAKHMIVAADAMQAAREGDSQVGFGAGVRQLLHKSLENISEQYAELLEDWDRDNGTWTASSVRQFRYFTMNAHGLAGDLWDAHYDLGVRILDLELELKKEGTDPDPSIIAPAMEKGRALFQAASDAVDGALKVAVPSLAGIGKAILWIVVAVAIVLALYAVGPALTAGASVYKTSKEGK